jgi:hypothetical protein
MAQSFIRRTLFVSLPSLGVSLLYASQVLAASASASPTDSSDKHIYVSQYDLSTNLWGIRGAGPSWYEYIFTNSTTTMDGSGYKWTGFGGNVDDVKSYASLRRGDSNNQNSAGVTGLPYLFGSNTTNVDVLWNFVTTDYSGAGSIIGKYNHTLDIFFNAVNSTTQSNIRGEIMIITDSSQDSQTDGWGVKDGTPFVLGGETWDVWQATQTSNGFSWHVTQFRKRVNARYFSRNLKDFFAEAAARRSDIFKSSYYVMMVEAGTEIKTGSGRVYNKNYSVTVY